ncbi:MULTISPECIES: GlxA family transcriptional regulator [unclassified Phenylobacterium]|uniref:GlxA family transcriptional regulator n=1 Tax=unclassified Phenylobacterium TaxID=2640670 RepID=UPI0022B43053|nr:GlxA family transcriptional regulator [Phenylobacterium sp. NIBR 498073]MBS0490592.1 GlxA family transcriptional regulator [Pseudomonadota bacterium]WGU41643.1 GlxA family transcriptional regulator [Phenylobacterium sp. NIBR 498073]
MTRTVGLLVFPDFQILDATGPVAVFEIAARFVPGAYALQLVARDPGPVTSSSGVQVLAAPMTSAPLDTLVVAGGEGTRGPAICARTLDWVRSAAAQARRTASVCSGAYILAEAGLLDGRRATTHWQRCPDFARRYPKVRLEPDRIFVRDGDVWSSAGITAGIDLSLALVADDHGEELARAVAQQLVVYHRRPGGQSQFSALLEMGGQGGRFAGLLDWIRERLAEPLGVERLADQAAMSPRHFARAFAAETGMTPAKAVERLRLETARERVEGSADPIDRVAAATGFGDPERMRRAFLRAFGQPPQALRRAARA